MSLVQKEYKPKILGLCPVFSVLLFIRVAAGRARSGSQPLNLGYNDLAIFRIKSKAHESFSFSLSTVQCCTGSSSSSQHCRFSEAHKLDDGE